MSSWFEVSGQFVRHALVTIGVLVVGGVGVALAIMYSGVFNIAATVVDAPPLVWALVTVRESSIKLHARDIPSPVAGMIPDRDNGFRIYRQECVMCHTPIGRSPKPMAVGFNPQAPSFGPDDDLMTPKQLFWVTKNGIRFTPMPAWGPSFNDKEIWDIVDFLKALHEMTAADYDAIDKRIPVEVPSKP